MNIEQPMDSNNVGLHSYTMEADVSNLEKILEPILKELESLDVVYKTVYQLNLALEELVTNVCSYAYYPDKGMIHISYEVKEDPKRLIVTIIDEGRPFNPLEMDEPDLNASIQDRKIGGLGLFIVKKTMDNIEYVRKDNKNILTITKNL